MQVLNHPTLWRGNDRARVAMPSVPTGFAELDVLLPGGGWPREALTEIYVERPGIGELRLVMPAMARLTQDERWLAMVAPPYLPYAPALLGHGVRLSHVMLIRPDTVEARLWAGEQALRSGSCGASAQLSAQGRAAESEIDAARDLDDRDPGRGRARVRVFPRHLLSEISQGHRVPGKGQEEPARLLRFPGRALACVTSRFLRLIAVKMSRAA